MFNKFVCSVLLIFSFAVLAEEKKVDIEIPTPEDKTTEMDVLTLEGMKQALSAHLDDQKLRSDLFWKKINEKKAFDKLSAKEASEFLKLLFTKSSLEIPAPSVEAPIKVKEEAPVAAPAPAPTPSVPPVPPTAPIPTTSVATLNYEIDSVKMKSLYDLVLSDLPDPTSNVFYLLADIDIDESLKWEDLGVTRSESFSGVIKDSWKKMATEHVKGFEQYAVINKELTNLEGMNPQSVTLKWKSLLKRTYMDPIKMTAKYELSAQYVLVRTINNESLLAFDFPVQKREFSLSNPKALSSGLASLIYNLLNSQSGKIGSAAESARTAQISHATEFSISGTHSLSDIFAAISWLKENMKTINLDVELKRYSSPGSILLFKTVVDQAKLIELLSSNGGKMAINEQKILYFNPTDKSFAIIPKDGNN